MLDLFLIEDIPFHLLPVVLGRATTAPANSFQNTTFGCHNIWIGSVNADEGRNNWELVERRLTHRCQEAWTSRSKGSLWQQMRGPGIQ